MNKRRCVKKGRSRELNYSYKSLRCGFLRWAQEAEPGASSHPSKHQPTFPEHSLPSSYMASSLPAHEVAELQRLMAQEIQEVAVFFMNPQGVITVWTRGAEVMKGYTAEDAIGSHLALLYTDDDRARGWPQHNLDEAVKHGTYQEETWRKRKDGTLFFARITLTALKDESGVLLGFSKVTVDLTDHKLLERCVKERQETRRILRAANAGMWTWHPEQDRMEVAGNLMELLGHEGADATVTFDEWMALVEPEDIPRVTETFARARVFGAGTPMVTEMQLCKKDGSCRWFHVHADWYRETEDEPYALSGVCVDIHDLKSAERELHHAISKLKETDARKDEFLAMLAHELRNPLAPILSAAELLKMARLDQEGVQKTSQIIARQVVHMTSLVDDLLDVSRVTRGVAKLDKTLLDLRKIVMDAVEQVEPLIHSRNHHLAVDLSPGAAMVLGDQKRLVQVAANLLNNAAKYTAEGGHIVLKTEVKGAEVVLSVADDGIGIEPELAQRVFELFAQADRSPDRSSGGLGLGLALVKSLVELHGGTVACFSEGLGRGSRFTVTLPLAEAVAEPGASPAERDRQSATGKSLRILVVDDNVDAAQMLAMYLQASGHHVAVEHGGAKGLDRSRSERPDVCLLDIGLPEMDGNELARRLRAQPETRESLLIAITGYGQEDDRNAALDAGFDHHFVKPVDPRMLLSLLGEASGAQR